MKFKCGLKEWVLLIAVAALAVLAIPLLFRRTEDPSSPSRPKVSNPPVTGTATPPPPLVGPPTSPDPLLRQWQVSIRARDQKGVLSAQSTLLEREGEYRAPLMAMAKDDGDPRIRAFTVAVLGRMKSPPAESFFVERLADPSEHPRTSSLQALEKVGTAACLDAVEKLASSDPVESVRTVAGQTAKAVRSR